MKVEINKIQSNMIIKVAQMEWAAPNIYELKMDEAFQFCVEDRKLNDVTRRDSYPVRRKDKCIDSPDKATVFTTLQENSDFCPFQIETAANDRTGFTSHHGFHRINRMPIGLHNVPRTI